MSVNRMQLQAVLAEEGLEHDAALLRALEDLAALRPTSVPAPTGALAELLASASAAPAAAGGSATVPLAVVREAPPAGGTAVLPGAAAVVPLTRAAALKAEAAAKPRWIKRHRGAMIGALVVAGMGLGASGVAALGGQAWDFPGGHRSVVSPVTPGQIGSQGTDTPAAVHPADVPEAPAQTHAGTSQGGTGQDAQGQNSGGQNTGDQGTSGQNTQGQNSQGSDQAAHQSSVPARQSQTSGQAGNSQGGDQGGNSQGGNSRGSGR